METTEKKSSGWIWIVALIVIVVVAIIIFKKPSDKKTASGEPIKIGFIGPLTGDAAPYGEPARNGATIAADQINAAGGVNGRPIQIIVEDGKCEGKSALNAAQKLINVDKVKFIVGGACSSETLGFASVAETNKVITLSYGSSNPSISESGDYIFRNAPSDALGGSELAKLVTGKGFSKVAIVTENTDFAQGVRGVFKSAITGGTVVSDEVFNTNTTDFRTTATKIKSTNPDAVVLNVQTGASGARLAKQLRETGINVQFFTFFVSGDDFVKSGPAVEGTYILDVPSLSDSGEAKDFGDEYVKRFQSIPSYVFFSGAAYDGVKILTAGIKKFGEDADKMKQYLYDLPPYKGTVGVYTFDKNGDPVGIGYTVKQVKDQVLVTTK